jgi:hypothetical protein
MGVSVKWLALVVCAALCSQASQAAVLYSQSTANTGIAGLGPPVAVQPTVLGGTTSDIGGLNNCLASQGCMGINVSPANTVPVQDFTLTFSVTAAQLASITASTGSGKLTVTAARDIGIRNGGTAPGTEFLITSGEGGVPLGNLYQNLISTASASIAGACTTAQHNEGPPVALDCGPNFDNDTTATESVGISQANFETFAADGTVSILVHPTQLGFDCNTANCGVGRLKLFSATLEFDSASIPEPGSMALVSFGLIGFAVTRRLHKAAKP